MKAMIEKMVLEEIRSEVRVAVKSYFASLLELQKGPVLQVHAAVTRNGLTKAVRRTKTSQLADMKLNSSVFFKTPKGISVDTWESRWCGARGYAQEKIGFVWRVNLDRERNGVRVTRTR